MLAGGGANHRMGLFDMVMIKNNHVDAAGGVAPAVRACTVLPRAWRGLLRVWLAGLKGFARALGRISLGGCQIAAQLTSEPLVLAMRCLLVSHALC